MYRLKPILSFVAVAAFLVAVTSGSVEAGALEGKKLLVDTNYSMMDAGDRVNDGVNSLAPVAAGDTVKVELFIDGGGGESIIGGTAKFADSNVEMMFGTSWKIVDVDGIVGVLGAGGIKDDEFTLGGLSPVAIPDNDYFATVKIRAEVDIADGASFYVKHAIIGTATFDQDSLDVTEAIVTFATPTGPSVMGMGDMLMDGNMLQIPTDGSGASVTVGLGNVESEEPVVSWTVTSEGSGTLAILDADDMMLELDDQMMVSGPTEIILKVIGGDLQVTVKANVDGEDTAPVTFTFTQLNPAELASFDGAIQDSRVVLNWSTVSQTNNAGWRITRSVDGVNFEPVGNFVQGEGTSDALLNYTFEDKNLPGVEKVYYRLEQVDLDGSVSRSNVIEVLLGARMPLPTEFAVNVYPNPFNPSTTISYDIPEGSPVSVVIYDVLGQQIRTLVSQHNAPGRYQIQWDARDNQGRGVASGVYIARVNAGTSSLSQKMLLLK